MTSRLSVIIPVFRNADALFELHGRLVHALSGCVDEYELIFVDDASPDHSLASLRRLDEIDPAVTVISLDRNVGQHLAVMRGLARSRGDLAVVLDADLQDPPEAIPRLLAALTLDVAAVFAGRRGWYESSWRLISSKVFKILLYLASRGRVPRDAGLFVVMRRHMIDRLLSFEDPNPHILALMGRTKLRLVSVPVKRASRAQRESTYSGHLRLRVGLRALATALGAPGHDPFDR